MCASRAANLRRPPRDERRGSHLTAPESHFVKHLTSLALLLAATSLTAAEPQFSDVFVNKAEGYAVFRIPSVVVTQKGTVLAFAEGRKSMADQAQNDIVLKRSTDDGATWPVKRVLWPGGFAYSVLTRFADGTVGCLFEADNCARLVFARFPIEWVSEKP